MQIFVNGESKQVSSDNIFALLEELSLKQKKIAIELNGEIIRRLEYKNILIKQGDKIEIVHFIGGG